MNFRNYENGKSWPSDNQYEVVTGKEVSKLIDPLPEISYFVDPLPELLPGKTERGRTLLTFG